MTRKTLTIATIVVLVLGVAGYLVAKENHLFDNGCRDIIGDGYYMGTDSKPVVIGNTCDDDY